VDPRQPHLALLDRSSAHVACYEEAEVARFLAAASRATAGVTATTAAGEHLHPGDER
jgi:hypothetical protein